MTKDTETTKPDGNDFQYKAKKALTGAGWNVRMSPHYNDSFSEKPREIDMIAEKVFLSSHEEFYQGTVIVRLFVECKYIAEQTTFWFEEKDLDKAKEVVDSTRAFNETKKNHEVTTNHHYLSNKLIAKLYRTEGKNPDGDPIYKAITQCLNATIYFRDRPTDLRNKHNHRTYEELNYSVIVCNSFEKFLGKDTTTDSTVSPIAEIFQLEVDYAYTIKDKSEEELFYIDVLSIDMLKDFEDKTLLKEILLAKQKLSDDKREADFNRMQSGDSNLFDPFSAI
jgi:hypothetical protein